MTSGCGAGGCRGSTLVGVVEPRPEAVAAIEISAREWRDARRDRPCGVAAGGVNHVEGCDAAGRSAPRRAGYRGYFAETEHGSVESSFSSSLDQHPLPHRRVLCHIELEPQARRFWAWTQVPDGSLNALLAGRVACISIEPEPKKVRRPHPRPRGGSAARSSNDPFRMAAGAGRKCLSSSSRCIARQCH